MVNRMSEMHVAVAGDGLGSAECPRAEHSAEHANGRVHAQSYGKSTELGVATLTRADLTERMSAPRCPRAAPARHPAADRAYSLKRSSFQGSASLL